jgi:hypothetical protein
MNDVLDPDRDAVQDASEAAGSYITLGLLSSSASPDFIHVHPRLHIVVEGPDPGQTAFDERYWRQRPPTDEAHTRGGSEEGGLTVRDGRHASS